MRFLLLVCVALPGFLSNLALAHHGGRGHFDFNQELVLEDAVITEFRLVNPHAYIYFDLTDDAGEVSAWRCEMTAGSRLRRQGWTNETLVPGQVVTIVGHPGRREDQLCKANEFVLADQTTLTFVDRGLSVEVATEPEVNSRPSRLPNGQVNLAGPWRPPIGLGPGPGGGGMGGPGAGGPGMGGPAAGAPTRTNRAPVPTEAGLLAAEGFDELFDNPMLTCESVNIIFDWIGEVNDIIQHEDRVVIRYGFMDLERTVYLDQAEHPEEIEPSVTGHSIGWWEDDVLVVDTVGFEPGVLMVRQGVMHSGEMHVVERFEVLDNGRLSRTFEATDPLYLEGAYTGVNLADLTTEPVPEYNCIPLEGKNNQRTF